MLHWFKLEYLPCFKGFKIAQEMVFVSNKENQEMEKLEKLFEPGKIGSLEIKNRIIAAPLGLGFNFGTKPDGFVTDRLIAYNEARAKGGVGMIHLPPRR
jgi:hypothetical protein